MNLRCRFLAVILSLGMLSGSCSPQWIEPRRIDTWNGITTAYVCLDVPHEYYEDAVAGVEAWDRALRQWKRFVPVAVSGPIPFGSMPPGCAYVISERNGPHPFDPDAVGWTNRIGGRHIYLRRGFYEKDAEIIVAHELGHALGAQHIPGTLMNPTYESIAASCPDVYTISQVAAYNDLDMSILSWCQG